MPLLIRTGKIAMYESTVPMIDIRLKSIVSAKNPYAKVDNAMPAMENEEINPITVARLSRGIAR